MLSVVAFTFKRETSYTIPFTITNFKVQWQQWHVTLNQIFPEAISVATFSFASAAVAAATTAAYCHSQFQLRSNFIHPIFFPYFLFHELNETFCEISFDFINQVRKKKQHQQQHIKCFVHLFYVVQL